MKGRARWIGAATLAVVGLLTPRRSEAAEIAVATTGCDLRLEELQRLVRLELAAVVARADADSGWSVEVHCDAAAMDITLHDPLTRKTVRRTVQRPGTSEPERERLTALTVAQLYRAAWLELVSDDPPPLHPSPPVRASEPARDAAAAAARGTLAAPAATMGSWSLAAAATFHGRSLDEVVVVPGLSLEGAFRPGAVPVWLALVVAWETGNVARDHGDVDVDVLRAGASVLGDVVAGDRWALLGHAEIALAHVTLAGEDVDAAYVAGVVDGLGVDGAVGLGAGVGVGFVRLELLGDVGMLVGSPSGRVVGDTAVDVSGARVGGVLRVRVAP